MQHIKYKMAPIQAKSNSFSKYNFVEKLVKEGLKKKQAEIIADAIKDRVDDIDDSLTKSDFLEFMEGFEIKFDKKLELMEYRMTSRFGIMTAAIVTFVMGTLYTLSLIFPAG